MYIYIIAAVLAVFATILTILFFINDKQKSAKISELDNEKWDAMLAYTKSKSRYAAKIDHLNEILPKLEKLQRQSLKERIQKEREKIIKDFANKVKQQIREVFFIQKEEILNWDNLIYETQKEYLKKMKERKTYTKHINYTEIINMCLMCDAKKCKGECAKIKEATKEFFQNRPKTKKRSMENEKSRNKRNLV